MSASVPVGPLSSVLRGPSPGGDPQRRVRRWDGLSEVAGDDDTAGEIATLLVDVARLQMALETCVRDLNVIRNGPASMTEEHITALIGVLESAVG
ncbi:MAG TPA: hypothetical protein VED63_08445 [Acidimicrobiales bacterium]|nr:hypothetical protein [Acidimicrobiales bacterium]